MELEILLKQLTPGTEIECKLDNGDERKLWYQAIVQKYVRDNSPRGHHIKVHKLDTNSFGWNIMINNNNKHLVKLTNKDWDD